MSSATSLPYGVNDSAVRTTLSSSITSTDTSFDVGEVTNAPSTPFLIAVWVDQSPLREDDMEIMEVTGISGTTLTVTRGAKGTSAQSFSSGDKVFMGIVPSDEFDVARKNRDTIQSLAQTSLENLLRSKANEVEHNNIKLGADDALFDIFADESKIASKTDVTVDVIANDGNEDGSVAINGPLYPDTYNIDDFEDGNASGWSGDTPSLYVTDNSPVLEGTYTANLYSSLQIREITSPSIGGVEEDFWITFRSNNDTNNNADHFEFRILNSSGNIITSVEFEDQGSILDEDGNNIGSWSVDTTYELGVLIDYDNGTAKILLNGTELTSGVALVNNDPIDAVKIINETDTSGNARRLYFDAIATGSKFLTSGNIVSTTKDLSTTGGFVNPPDEAYLTIDADISTDEDINITLKDSNSNSVPLTVGDFVDTSALTSTVVKADVELTSSNGNGTPTLRSYAIHLTEGS